MRKPLVIPALLLTVLFLVMAAPIGLSSGAFIAKFTVEDGETGLGIFNATVIIAQPGVVFHYTSGFKYKTETYERATDFLTVTFESLVSGNVTFDNIFVLQQGRTDEQGKVEFILPEGEWEAWALANGYISQGVGCRGSGAWNPETTWFEYCFELNKPRWEAIGSKITATKELGALGGSYEEVGHDTAILIQTTTDWEWNGWEWIWPWGWKHVQERFRYTSAASGCEDLSADRSVGWYAFDIDLDEVWLDSEPYSLTYDEHHVYKYRYSASDPFTESEWDDSHTLTGVPPSQHFTAHSDYGVLPCIHYLYQTERQFRWFSWWPWPHWVYGPWVTTYYFEDISKQSLTGAELTFRGLTTTLP